MKKDKNKNYRNVKNDDVPLKDDLFLSPIEKYKIYGRFPWKMIIHIFLVILTTAQGIMAIAGTTQYTRAQERLFYDFFISDSDRTELDYSRKTYLYSVTQLRIHIKTSIENFYNIQSESLEKVEYLGDLNKTRIFMHFNYLDKKLIGTHSPIPREFIYLVNNSTLGPFDYSDEEVKVFLNSVTEFRLNYTLRTYIPFNYEDHFECFHWDIHQIYNFDHRAHFVVRLQIKRNVCEDRSTMTLIDYFVNRFLWIHVFVLILASVSLILTWKHVYKMAKIYWGLKRGSKDRNKKDKGNQVRDAEDIGNDLEKNKIDESQLKEQDKIVNMWSPICLIGNVVQVFGSVLSLFDTNNVMSSTEILVGFGCMLAYVNVGRYLEYNRDYSTIFATIKRAMPNVLRYLFGVMPIFFGFIFFGLCLFWRSERFVDTSSTMMTLFAMLNGDSVFDIFNDLAGVSFFIGQLYCYIFCIIFIVVVMNVFISIIEEAYVSTKMKNQNHWIYSYLKIDPNYVKIKDLEDIKEGKEGEESREGREIKPSLLPTPNRESKQLVKNVKSKNILREAVNNSSISSSKFGKPKNAEMNKQEIEKAIETHFSNIEHKLNGLEKITIDISKTGETKIKDELRLFVFDHISALENKVNHLREMWLQQS